ncbi:hypothetical protein, partial [Mesorhizobium sp. M1C.F.Ca.ET.189.01.1.1]|uniref:hypothetical protein n=1 Tax=Mesorhizobium sp. M1C.F.Ca.ET.189.01.1.1 TaxID=2563925 RepID=UPI001AEE28A3
RRTPPMPPAPSLRSAWRCLVASLRFAALNSSFGVAAPRPRAARKTVAAMELLSDKIMLQQELDHDDVSTVTLT